MQVRALSPGLNSNGTHEGMNFLGRGFESPLGHKWEKNIKT